MPEFYPAPSVATQHHFAMRRPLPLSSVIILKMFSLLLRSSSIHARAAPPTASVIFSRDYRSNRSRRGLYDGKDIRSGNKVSHAMNATRRKFRPNVFLKRLYSETLDAMLRFHVTTSALRSIDKAGGLDNYIMKNDFTEGEGFALKKKIKKKRRNQAYLARRNARVDDPVSADTPPPSPPSMDG